MGGQLSKKIYEPLKKGLQGWLGSPSEVVSEAEKSFSASVPTYGFGILAAALGALSMFQPEKQLMSDQERMHSSSLTSRDLAHVVSLAFTHLSVIFALILLNHHTYDPEPTRDAIITKKIIIFIGLLCLAPALLLRIFISLPQPYGQPVTVAVLVGTAISALIFGLAYYHFILRHSRKVNQSASKEPGFCSENHP